MLVPSKQHLLPYRHLLLFRSLVSVANKTLPIALAITLSLTLVTASENAYAASEGAQPVLRAIDPSAAKLDAPPPPEASVDPGRKFNQSRAQSNPFNSGIQGRPLGSPPQQFQPQSPSQTTPMQAMPGMLSPQLDQSEFQSQAPGPPQGQAQSQSQSQFSAAPSMVSPADEQRVTRLEKQAFGNTYPEHEVDDRLEHLEKEVLGGKSDGQTVERIARLEQKLLGGTAFGGAFGGTAAGQAAVPANNMTAVNMSGNNYIPGNSYVPVPASAYPAPVAVAPMYNNQPPAQRPQIPGNHLPPGQVAVPAAWNNQPNFAPRAYGLGQGTGANSGSRAGSGPNSSSGLNSGSGPNSSSSPAPSPVPVSRPGFPNTANHGNVGAPNRPPAINNQNANPIPNNRIAQNTGAPNYVPQAPVASSLVIDASIVANSLNYDTQAGDYLGSIRRLNANNSGPVYAHWRQFPVKVRLPLGSPESWQRNLEAVIARWDQYVPVKIALPSEPSNVDVLWVNQLPPKALGVCRLNIVNGQMQVWVYLLRPSFYAADVPERTLGGVFTREMGHALGLFGKSEKSSDLMYAAENGSSNLSASANNGGSVGASAAAKKKAPIKLPGIGARDINTLKRIYEAPASPPGLSLEQPLEWATSY